MAGGGYDHGRAIERLGRPDAPRARFKVPQEARCSTLSVDFECHLQCVECGLGVRITTQESMDEISTLFLKAHVAIVAWAKPRSFKSLAGIPEEVPARRVAVIAFPGDGVARLSARVKEQAGLTLGPGDPEGVISG